MFLINIDFASAEITRFGKQTPNDWGDIFFEKNSGKPLSYPIPHQRKYISKKINTNSPDLRM